MRQGNIFAGICQSFCSQRWVSAWDTHPQADPPPPAEPLDAGHVTCDACRLVKWQLILNPVIANGVVLHSGRYLGQITHLLKTKYMVHIARSLSGLRYSLGEKKYSTFDKKGH